MAHGLWIRLPRPTCLPLPSRRSESSLAISPMSTPRSRGRSQMTITTSSSCVHAVSYTHLRAHETSAHL
eukprot:13212677-Alexandrium_andersonii.AAC.1